ncbi:MAG: CPBP family intramembrane metalloprotease [SAR324 cluster bacterium]|nr:CPBP family intramembrane metalloprotease [SAR324 cluster bacterium]
MDQATAAQHARGHDPGQAATKRAVLLGQPQMEPFGPYQHLHVGALAQAAGPIALAVPVQGGLAQIVGQSIGAGLFEEFLFRVILLNLLLMVTRLVLAEWLSAVVAILAASFVFSLAHYIGPLGDAIDIHSFLFRWVAGLLFTVLYYLRGFGVTAYAHALYDIRVLIFF